MDFFPKKGMALVVAERSRQEFNARCRPRSASSAPSIACSNVDDASQVGPLLDQVDGPVASLTADGADDQDGAYGEVVSRHPEASVIVPPRSSAVPSDTAQTAPTMRDRHLEIVERGRMVWQKASGYNWRALVEAAISRFKRVGNGL